MLAIIQTGGKQYKVTPRSKIQIEINGAKEGDSFVCDQVLAVADDKGNVRVGTPFVSGAKVIGKVMRNFRTKKVVGVRFKNKVRQHVKFGHRQHHLEILIDSIES